MNTPLQRFVGVEPGIRLSPDAEASKTSPLAISDEKLDGGEHLPCVLIVLDGYGSAPPSRGNAIALAKTPNMNRLMREYPTVSLLASGEMVGLPYGEMGNSEVGHLNIGSGKVIYQNLPMIDKAVDDGSFGKKAAFQKAIEHVRANGSKLHLMGLVSDGGIHSSQEHLYALLDMCEEAGLQDQVYIHAILDGRDTPKDMSLLFIAQLERRLLLRGVGRIASVAGRFYTMDRDNRWERIELSYNMMRYGQSENTSDTPLQAIERSYKEGVFDEQLYPTVVLNDSGDPVATVDDNDAMIFFNFRADRARQITKAFTLPQFDKFDRGQQVQNLLYVTMTSYEEGLPVEVAFTPDTVKEPLAKTISDAGMKQLHIAETEKYAHVTFFFNGGTENEYANEDRVLIPSPKVATYDEAPAMAVAEIADRIVEEIKKGEYGFIVSNFANADMVGHTGNLKAAIQAIEAIDEAIGKIAEAIEEVDGTLLITADHGNAEVMLDLETGAIVKEHTTNPVPFVMANSALSRMRGQFPPVPDGDTSRLQPVGVLSDVAPTVIKLLGLEPSEDMTARSIL